MYSTFKRRTNSSIKFFKKIYTFEPCLMDIADWRVYMPIRGTKVILCQPFGCPKNVTMRQVYIATVDQKFLGMVCKASLKG